jgi:hypothetical protein
MKRIFVSVMMLICFSGVSVFAAENSNFPSSVEPGNIIANVGMGLLNSPVLSNHGTSLVPPLSLSAEYALPISIPLSVGAVIGFASSERSGGSGDEKFTYTWTVFSVGAKAAYHFNWEIRGLDTYAALTLGGNFLSANTEYDETSPVYSAPGAEKPSAGDDEVSFLFGLEVGVRFFFNSHVGVFIEEGFNTFTYLRSGLVFKF